MWDDIAPVHTLLESSADRYSEATAVVHGEQTFDYEQVEAMANRMARVLVAHGVEPGDRVGLLAENGIEYITAFFGILKAGACAVALSAANKVRTNRQLLADSAAVGLVTRAAQVRRDLPELVADLPRLRFAVVDRANPTWELPTGFTLAAGDALNAQSDERLELRVSVDDLCAILYTSGSTGMPRGVTLTHGNLAANTRQILGYLDLEQQDRIMAVLPFHYSFGNSLLLTHFAVGGRVVVDNRFAYPQTVLETMSEQRVTGFSGVPSTYAILCAKTDFLSREFPALRMLTQAGGGMAPSLIRRLHEAFRDQARLFIMYGQTEASARLSYVPPERLMEKLGSIGIPIPGVELTLIGEDGHECQPGEVGQVVARGPNIMQGYWQDPDETALVLEDRALYTGDLGRKDEDGFIFLVDRIKNMIKAGANRVSSREVEDAIVEVQGIVEACVVGVPDELLGEAIEAYVVADEKVGLTENDIFSHLREVLALFKIPRKLHFINELPKSSSGKVQKKHLKKNN